MTTGSKFFCNIKALAPAERAEHKQLTEKLISNRTEIVETETGYEFQFNPLVVSITELADWALAESKCCPFFDFHIDLEREGTLVCLRLTGDPGIKHFIQSEFQLEVRTEQGGSFSTTFESKTAEHRDGIVAGSCGAQLPSIAVLC